MLTALTLVLTTIYQWGWVIKFLDASSCRWRWAIFLLFPLAAFAGLMIAGRVREGRDDPERTDLRKDRARRGGHAADVRGLRRGGAGLRRAPELLFGFLLLSTPGCWRSRWRAGRNSCTPSARSAPWS